MNLHRLLASSALIQGVGLLLTMLVGIQLARYLGPTDYGIYGLVMAVVSIATVVGQFGLPLLGTREAARPGVDLLAFLRWFASRSAAIAGGTAFLLVATLLLASPPWLEGRQTLILLAAAFVATSALLASMVAILRGAGQNLTGQAIDLLVRPALVVLAVFALHGAIGLTVGMALGAQIGTVLACLVLTSVLLQRVAGQRRHPRSRFHLNGWAATSSTYMANSLLGALNASYPMIVAALFATGPDLGVLRVAIASAVLLNLPSTVANIATIPLVARQHAAADIQGLARTLSHTTLACFALTAAGWLFLLFFGKPLIMLLFGVDYAEAYAPLLMLGAGQLIIAAFGIAGAYLNLTAREGLVTQAFLISVPLGLAASLGLTPRFGVIGAAAGTVVMAAAWHFHIFAIHRREADAPLSLLAALKHVRSEGR